MERATGVQAGVEADGGNAHRRNRSEVGHQQQRAVAMAGFLPVHDVSTTTPAKNRCEER